METVVDIEVAKVKVSIEVAEEEYRHRGCRGSAWLHWYHL